MKIVKILILSSLFLFALALGLVYSAWSWAKEMSEPVASGKSCEVVIPQGANTKQIANLLKEKNVIRSPLLLRLYIKFLAIDQNLKQGSYTFSGKENLSEIISLLIKGNRQNVPVTIPEGTTLKEVAVILQEASICKALDFLEAVQEPELLGRVFSNWELIPQAEGLIFPDTYFFERNTPAKMVAERMLKLMKYQIDKIFSNELPMKLTQYEGCILASIVEKEAVLNKERPIIASVFYNRLKKKIKLESCATVLYALGLHKQRLLFEDLKVESPYNTYIKAGLPPTPISNFGIASMKAVAEPEETKFLFFVVDGKSGGHRFSTTISEHNKNKKNYFDSREKN